MMWHCVFCVCVCVCACVCRTARDRESVCVCFFFFYGCRHFHVQCSYARMQEFVCFSVLKVCAARCGSLFFCVCVCVCAKYAAFQEHWLFRRETDFNQICYTIIWFSSETHTHTHTCGAAMQSPAKPLFL